jgi:hypothetical protein
MFADFSKSHFNHVNTCFWEGVRRMHQTVSGFQGTKRRFKTPDLETCLTVCKPEVYKIWLANPHKPYALGIPCDRNMHRSRHIQFVCSAINKLQIIVLLALTCSLLTRYLHLFSAFRLVFFVLHFHCNENVKCYKY